MAEIEQIETSKARLGIQGLDDILNGGIERNRLYLVEGNPGTGKTTMAVQFLIEGQRSGEKTLYRAETTCVNGYCEPFNSKLHCTSSQDGT